jgi:cell division protein FtsW (lipid II flippase)
MLRALSDRSESQHDIVLNAIGFEAGYGMCCCAIALFWLIVYGITWFAFIYKAKYY